VSWSKTLTRSSDDSCRSICTDARHRTSFYLDSAPASRCTDSECTAAYCGRITCKLEGVRPAVFPNGSFQCLSAGGWILVPNRAAGLVKGPPVLPCKQQLENRVLSLIWRHSAATLLLAKFIAGSNVASLLAGQAGISAARFVIYDSIGSLTWSGSYIALGYLLHGQLHWTLAQTLRPLFIVRVAVSLARLWRRGSLAQAVLALAIVFFAVRPVSQHNADMRMSADAWQKCTTYRL
jgi:hypothetical protein